MDVDATWYRSRPRPRPHCIRLGPRSPQKGQSSPPLFGSCLLWPWSPISATAELLYSLQTEKHTSLRLQSGCLISLNSEGICDNSAEKRHWSFNLLDSYQQLYSLHMEEEELVRDASRHPLYELVRDASHHPLCPSGSVISKFSATSELFSS